MKIKSRGLTSLLLAGTITIAALSGVALYLKPKGRVANWTGWTLGGLDKSQWEALHTNACLMLLLVGAVHLYFNWKTFYSYLTKRPGGLHLKLEMAIAVIALALVSVGTVLETPPFSATAGLGDRIKRYWEESASSQGPAPNAEEFSIDRFAQSIGLSTEQLVAVLRDEGLRFSGAQTTIEQLAAENELTPAQVYTAITKHYPRAIRSAAGQSGRQMQSAP